MDRAHGRGSVEFQGIAPHFARLSPPLAAALPASANNVSGAWSPVKPWPVIAVHAVLMPDGRVLTYGTKTSGQQTAIDTYDVWDPSEGLDAGHSTLPNTDGHRSLLQFAARAAGGRTGIHRRR